MGRTSRISSPSTSFLGLFALSAAVAITGCSSKGRASGFGGGESGGTNDTNGTFGGPGGDGGGGGTHVCAPNPANYDIPGNNCDDDGDGQVDNPPACDDNVGETGGAEDFA